MPHDPRPSHPTGEAPMSLVERARVALRNWINKPSAQEVVVTERQLKEHIRAQLAAIGSGWDDDFARARFGGPEALRTWRAQQQALIVTLEAEASADELQVRGLELLKAKAAGIDSLGRPSATA